MDDRLHVFETPQIRVTWSRRRCIHAAECIRGLPEVFEPGRRPWVVPGNADPDEVAAVVRRCPTGALHYERLDGGANEPVPDRNWAIVQRGGPVCLKGDLTIERPGAEPLRETRIGLCRCGASKFKPFCDGSHWQAGFRDRGELPEIGFTPLPAPEPDAAGAAPAPPSGPVTVTPTANGPLVVEGPVEFLAGDGQTRRRVAKASLCRCGRSENKPFCDGSHRDAGFEAEGA